MHYERWWFAGKLPLTFVCTTSGRHLDSKIDACPVAPSLASRRMYQIRDYRMSVEIESCAMVIDIAHRRLTELRRMGVDVSIRSMFFATLMSPADALWSDFSTMAFDIRTFIDPYQDSGFSLRHPPLGSKVTRAWPVAPTDEEITSYRRWNGDDDRGMEFEFDPPNGVVNERWTRTALRPLPRLDAVIEEAHQVAAAVAIDSPEIWGAPIFEDVSPLVQNISRMKLRMLKAFGGFQLRSDFGDAWLSRGPVLVGAFARNGAASKLASPGTRSDKDENRWPWCEGPHLRAEYLHQASRHFVSGVIVRALVEKLECHHQLWKLHEYFDVALRWVEDGLGELPTDSFIETSMRDARRSEPQEKLTTENCNFPAALHAHADRLRDDDAVASAVLNGVSPDLVRAWGLGGGHEFHSFAFLYRLLARVRTFTASDAQKHMSRLRSAVAAKSAEGSEALGEYLDFFCTSLNKLDELEMALKADESWTRAWLRKFLVQLDAPRGPASNRDEERSWELSPTKDGLPLLRVALRYAPDSYRDENLIWLHEELVLPTRETLLAVLVPERGLQPVCSDWKDALWLSIVNQTQEADAAARKEAARIRDEEFAASGH